MYLVVFVVTIGASIVVVIIVSATLGAAILANGNLDALNSEALAKVGAFAYTRELLGREDRKDITEAGGKHGGFAVVDHGADVSCLVVPGHHG